MGWVYRHQNDGLGPQMSKCHSKTAHFRPVFEFEGHLKTGPFDNRTCMGHLNTGLVRYSDGYCILKRVNMKISKPFSILHPSKSVCHSDFEIFRSWMLQNDKVDAFSKFLFHGCHYFIENICMSFKSSIYRRLSRYKQLEDPAKV